MKKLSYLLFIVFSFFLSFQSCRSNAQPGSPKISNETFIYSPEELEKILIKPACMGEYFSAQAGPLFKKNEDGSVTYDSTFTVEKIKISSDGLLMTGLL